MKLGTETGSMTNYLMSGTRGQPTPEVGMGATILMWSDRKACTITTVKHFKSGARKGQVCEITAQEDTAIRIDQNGMCESQDYTYVRNIEGRVTVFRLKKSGPYVQVGGGSQLRIGERDSYHDYSF